MMEQDEEALLEELQAEGHRLASIWDWANDGADRRAAMPVLLRHLAGSVDEKVVEGIARALTDRRYAEALPVLIARFPAIEDEFVRWAVASAIATIGFERHEAEILAFASETRFGWSREPLVGELHRIGGPDVERLLIALLDDPVLDYPAMEALSRHGGADALAALLRLDPAARSPRMRRAYPRALERLRKRRSRSPGAPSPA